MKNKPPKIAELLLSRFLKDQDKSHRLGDFEEEFNQIAVREGKFKAIIWYWIQVFGSIPQFIKYSIYWSFAMFNNYFKTVIRNMKRQKVYSLITLGGLAVGITAGILVMLYISYELSYDNYHENAGDIYRIITKQEGNVYQGTDWWAVSPALLGETMKADFPEVLCASRVTESGAILRYQDRFFDERLVYFADTDFLKIFTFPVISGNPETVLSEPFSLMISEKTAKKYFGSEDPAGKTVSYNSDFVFKITGVFKDIPENSHFRFDFLGSLTSLPAIMGGDFGKRFLNRWYSLDFTTYIKLQNNFDPEELIKKFPAFEKKYEGENGRNRFTLQSLSKIHLHSSYNFDIAVNSNSDIRYVYILSVIGFLIILIACFNYMNLSTARSSIRAKEVGMRKVVGAYKRDLLKQFFGESILLSITALFISFFLVRLLLPGFNSLVRRNIEFGLLTDFKIVSGLILITLFSGIVSGSYPAFLLSSFKPVKILKGELKIGSKGTFVFRNSLVVFQFVVSIALIICTIVIFNQLNFIKNKNLGYEKDYIINTYVRDNNLRSNSDGFKNEILKNPGVIDFTASNTLPSFIGGGGPSSTWEGKREEEKLVVYRAWGDYNFIDFYGLQILQGRKFSKEFSTDVQAYILNETAVKSIGWENPISKRFNVGKNSEGIVIGVIQDFHYQPLNLKIMPLWIRLSPSDNYYFSIRINSKNISKTLSFLEEKWKEFSPNFPFTYTFMDDRINSMYSNERRISEVFMYLSILAIGISCLGLVGLSSFTVERKIKEIGIRKVLGASVQNIVYNLLKEFIKWVLIASVISFPVAWYFMEKWLNNFAYRIDISVLTFIAAIITAVIVSFLSIGYQSIKAGYANPVNSLRNE